MGHPAAALDRSYTNGSLLPLFRHCGSRCCAAIGIPVAGEPDVHFVNNSRSGGLLARENRQPLYEVFEGLTRKHFVFTYMSFGTNAEHTPTNRRAANAFEHLRTERAS